jgi:hypothetical protein
MPSRLRARFGGSAVRRAGGSVRGQRRENVCQRRLSRRNGTRTSHHYFDQEVSTELMILCKRPDADPAIRRYVFARH